MVAVDKKELRQRRKADKDTGPGGSGLKKRITWADWLLVLFFIAMIAITFLPLVNLLARSFSSPQAITLRQVGLWPVEFNTLAYEIIFGDAAYVRALWFTALLTITGVVISMLLTIITAFPLTYDNLKGRKIFTIFMIFTIYFSAGIIPMFILMRDLNLLNTFWVLVIPHALSVFNVIIMRAFFFGIPHSLRESAEVEGANPIQILIKIYLPLATPVLATLSLFYAVGRWNGFTDALMFIGATHRHLYPIQLLLFELLSIAMAVDVAALEGIGGAANVGGLNDSLRAAAVMFATVPILLVYPWLQRFFISGVTLGAVKE